MSDSQGLGVRQLPFRVRYLLKALRRRFRLWQERHRTLGLLQILDREQARSDEAWERLARMRTKRKHDLVRRQLQSINQLLMRRRADIETMLATIDREASELRTITRWMWQGHVDDRDGPPDRILAPRKPD